MPGDHYPTFFTRVRHIDEPEWLGKVWVTVCEKDDQPVYHDNERGWLHWHAEVEQEREHDHPGR